MKQPELGKKISRLRNEKGLTQEELVEQCNINVRTLQRIESGDVNPRNSTVKIIFKVLDYDFNKEKSFKGINFNKELIFKSIQQIEKELPMKNLKNFFYNYFLATGIIWFFLALSILIFDLTFREKEILLTILIPLTFSIFKKLTKTGVQEPANKKEN